MKKILILLLVVVMIASVAYAQKKIKIATKDLAGLKGTWTGMLTFQVGQTCPAKLEILNDTVPIKGKLTIDNVPEQIAQMLAGTAGTASQKVTENDEGTLTTKGTIMWAGPKNFLEFYLTGDKKGEAWFYYNGARGDITLKKK
jgi:hypothetical protein